MNAHENHLSQDEYKENSTSGHNEQLYNASLPYKLIAVAERLDCGPPIRPARGVLSMRKTKPSCAASPLMYLVQILHHN